MENHETQAEKLSLTEKIGYGMGAMTENNMQNSLPNMTMPIMNIVMGLDPIWLGYIMAFGRIFDSITDPLMGYLSDNTRSRWGRRKPYLLMGAILAAIGFVAIWLFPAAGVSKLYYYIYFTIASLFYFCFTTMYCVPYISLGYEISNDYNERTQLMAFRMFFVSIGNIIVPWMFWFTQRPMFESALVGMRYTAMIMGGIFIVCALGPVLFTKAHTSKAIQQVENQKIQIIDIFSVMTVKPFLSIIIALGIGVLGLVSVGSLGAYITIYHVCAGSTETGSLYIGYGATASGIIGVALLPVITLMSNKMGKKNALISLLAFSGVGALLSWFLYNPAYPMLSVAVSCLMIPGMTAIWMLLMSMTADVCEYDTYHNNLRRAGIFAAVFSWTGKVGITLGILLAGYVLSWSGFDQALKAAQAPETLVNMRLLFAGGSGLGLLVAIVALIFYPLSKTKVDEIKLKLAEREKQELKG